MIDTGFTWELSTWPVGRCGLQRRTANSICSAQERWNHVYADCERCLIRTSPS